MNQLTEINNNLPVLASQNGISIFGYQSGEWIDAETLGIKLGYNRPRKFVNTLYNRNRNQFKPDESIVLNLRTIKRDPRGDRSFFFERQIRLFSVPNGALRLCMLSRARNTLDIHDEILNLFQVRQFSKALEIAPANQEIPLTESFAHEIKRRLGPKKGRQIIKAMLTGNYDHATYIMPSVELAKLPDGTVAAAATREEARRRGRTIVTIYRERRKMREVFGIQRQRADRCDKGTHRKQDEYDRVMEYLANHPNAKRTEIKTALNLTVSKYTISTWMKRRK
jgi:hypothetical protein